jgi:hypothetical protein
LGEKMKKLLVAAIMVVLATPAFAAIQNVKVSGDITTSWINDANLDLGNNTLPWVPEGQKKQNVFLPNLFSRKVEESFHPGDFKLDRERRDVIEPVRDHHLGSILSIPRPIDT